MSALIRKLEERDLPEVKEIFFESSTRKSFSSEEEREAFFYKYVGFYLKRFPDYCFVASEGKILGYIVGSLVSRDPELYSIQPHMNLFEDQFQEYPGHLHINCHAESRGKGMGARLVSHLEEALKNKIKGFHIMTGIDSANKSFYLRLGFSEIVSKDFQGSPILLMGKSL